MNIGDKVFHKLFGKGHILQMKRVEGQLRALVMFSAKGQKWIIADGDYLRIQGGGSVPQRIRQKTMPVASECSSLAQAQAKVKPHKDRTQHHVSEKVTTASRRHLLKIFAGLFAGAPVIAGASNKQKVSKTLPVLECRIAGFAYYQGQQCLQDITPGDILRLKRQPENAYDAKAIEVFWKQQKIGYVPKSHNAALSQLLDKGETIAAYVRTVKTDRQWEPLEFNVEVLL